MKRKFILLFALITLVMIPATVIAGGLNITALLAPQIKIVDEGRYIDTAAEPPIMYNNKAYVSVKLLSESLGYKVEWDAKNQTYHLSVSDTKYPLISNNSFQFISVEPQYKIMTTLDGQAFLGAINLDFVYQVDQDLAKQPVLVMEMLNKDKTVLASVTKLLSKSKGTYKDFTLGEYIRLPYSVKTAREAVIKQMSNDYYYRIKIK